jgi:hypothetical protein
MSAVIPSIRCSIWESKNAWWSVNRPPVAGQVAQLPDRRRRHKAGTQHLPLGDLAQPHRIQPSAAIRSTISGSSVSPRITLAPSTHLGAATRRSCRERQI